MAAGTYIDQVSGNTFTVSSGRISGSVGSSGVAVVYNATAPGPSVSVNPGSKSFKTDTLNVTLTLSNATSGSYSVDGGSFQSFTGTKTVTIGSGKAYGSTISLVVKATNGSETSSPQTYTYTKVDPSATATIYYNNSSTQWSTVNCYMWKDGVENSAYVAWPGEAMTNEGNNVWSYEVPDGDYDKVIFNAGDLTGDPTKQTSDLDYPGANMIYDGSSWSNYGGGTPTQATTPTQQTTPTQATNPPVGKVLIGDADQNNRVTIKDATTVQMHLAEMITLTGDAAVAADANRDNNITIKDVTAIQSYLAKFTSQAGNVGKYTDGTEPVTQPTTPTSPSGKYVYYDNSATNWSTVNCYMWNEGNGEYKPWPGEAMELIGNNVWRYEAPSGYSKIIFNAGDMTGDKTKQTADLDYQGVDKIWRDGGWQNYSGGGDVTTPTQPTTPTEPEGNYIYFQNVYNWGTVYAHMWNANDNSQSTVWHGTPMEYRNGGAWRVLVPDNYNMVVFNDGGDNQTDDVAMQIGKIYNDQTRSWSNYGGTDYTTPTIDPSDSGDTYTIYFTNNAGERRPSGGSRRGGGFRKKNNNR